MKLALPLLLLSSAAFAREASVLPAAEVFRSKGKYCSEKALVDIHAHAGCLDDGGTTCFASERMKKEKVAFFFSKYEALFDAFGVKKEELAKKGNAHFFESVSDRVEGSSCLDAVVLLALDGTYRLDATSPDYENTDFMIRNAFVAEQVAKHPNLLWGASVNPLRKDFREELKLAHEKGAALVKLIPPIQGLRLDDEEAAVKARLTEYFLLLRKYGLPLLVHLDEEGTFSKELERRFRDHVGVLGIRRALDLGLTVIVAHVASRESAVHGHGSTGSAYRDLLALIQEPKYKGLLYADISALPTIVTRADHLCKVSRDFAAQPERLLWGSDFPLNHWRTTSTLLLGPGCGRSSFSVGKEEGYALHNSRHQWDRAIFLQKNFGATDAMFNSTRKFLLERRLVSEGADGRVKLKLRN